MNSSKNSRVILFSSLFLIVKLSWYTFQKNGIGKSKLANCSAVNWFLAKGFFLKYSETRCLIFEDLAWEITPLSTNIIFFFSSLVKSSVLAFGSNGA